MFQMRRAQLRFDDGLIAALNRLLKIAQTARAKGPLNQDRLKERYRRLLESTSWVVGQAKRFAQEIAAGGVLNFGLRRPWGAGNVDDGQADPDLPNCIQNHLALTEGNVSTWYTQGLKGYFGYARASG